MEYDIAVHTLDWNLQYGKPGKETLSGTLLFRYNERTENLINLWTEKAKNHGFKEQEGLKDALQEVEVKVYDLPRAYVYVEITSRGKPKVIELNPIISHFQQGRLYPNRW